MFNSFIRIVASANSQVMSISISRQTECGFITEENIGCKISSSSSLERKPAKHAANFSVLGSYTLQQLVLKTFKFQKFPLNFLHCCVCAAYLIVGQHAWLICVDCARKPHKLYPTFSFTNAASLIKKFILENQHFC
jgi:hypothetical protein